MPEADCRPAATRRLVVRPMLGPPQGLDVTEAVVGAIAGELWKLHRGNDVLNWLEAERLLQEVLDCPSVVSAVSASQ